jgi:hypothetical protein
MSLPNICSHQMFVSAKITSSEKIGRQGPSYLNAVFYRDVINLTVRLSSRRHQKNI